MSAIGDYAAIGDGRSVALVSKAGSIDWLCWPRFDSDAVFAGLLDSERGGHWSIRPREVDEVTRRYLPGTNVLETRFTCRGAVVRVTDFIPVCDEAFARTHLVPEQELMRIVTCDSGVVDLDVTYAPRPGFAERLPRLIDAKHLGLKITKQGATWSLHSQLAFAIDGATATAHRQLRAGEQTALILAYSSEAPAVMPVVADAQLALERTVAWWRAWSAKSTYRGPHAEQVTRSLLALKLLSFPSSGALVAAATTSLPERIGGELNWDYRYCWLRDASLIMQVLCDCGCFDEAEAFAEWLLHATRLTQPKLRVIYDVYGNQAPRERALPQLAGFAGSRPVNVGNAARGQRQLDTYGEVIAAVAKLIRSRRACDTTTAKQLVGFGDVVCDEWSKPDAGIWEERGAPAVHTHSRLLCWVALDTLVRLDEEGLLAGKGKPKFVRVRDEIRRAIEIESWVEAEQTYSSRVDRIELDASLVLLGIFGFEAPDSPRMQSTWRRLELELGTRNHLLFRNRASLDREEGAFGICAFWAAAFLAKGGGTLEQAREAFSDLLTTSNDVGLFAEEQNPETGELLGNFPQAFTHVGLLHAAIAIGQRQREESR